MQTLTLTFPFRLPPYELPALRGAINELVDPKGELTDPIATCFHNHQSRKNPYFVWEYPKIRYSLYRGKATVTGIGPGVMAIMQYLMPRLLETRELWINGQPYNTTGFRTAHGEVELVLQDEPRRFGLHRWVALNNVNYRQWKKLEGKPEARQMLLQRALTGHLRAMAESLAPEIDREAIEAKVISVDQQKRINGYKTQLVGFNVVAETRLVPPVGLGVGRSVAFGFGEVVPASVYYRLLEVRDKKPAHMPLE